MAKRQDIGRDPAQENPRSNPEDEDMVREDTDPVGRADDEFEEFEEIEIEEFDEDEEDEGDY